MKTDSVIDEQSKILSEFNEAKLQIFRQHDSWLLCKSNRRVGNFSKWRWELDTVWDELQPKLVFRDQPGDKELICKANCLDLVIDLFFKLRNPTKMYDALRAKERFLKFASESLGLGGKMTSEDEFGIEM